MLDYSETSENVCLAFNQHIGLKEKKLENLVHLTFNWSVTFDFGLYRGGGRKDGC